MSQPKRQSFDLFLAHDPVDGALARAVIDRLRADGVSAFSGYLSEPHPLDPVSEAVRREVQDSFCFGVLLTPAFLKSDLLPFYSGAARIHDTPTVLFISGVERAYVPAYLKKAHPAELWDGLPAAVQQIRRQSRPLSAAEYAALALAYEQIGVPVERLLTTSDGDTLLEKFRAAGGRRLSKVRLWRELTRLRKTGRLPRLPQPARG